MLHPRMADFACLIRALRGWKWARVFLLAAIVRKLALWATRFSLVSVAFLRTLHVLLRPTCHLTQLPTEVIENILQLADWRSVLHARASCKRLDSVSRSLAVWREQYAAFTALNPSTPPLESPLERYSSFELENLVLQRGSVEAGWNSTLEHPVSMRIIPFENADHVETHLVRGGRWLLASALGAVTVFDLDYPKDHGKLLIPRYAHAHENQPTTSLEVDFLVDVSTLAFNLAIGQHRRGHYTPQDTPLWTHIWKVTLNGHGADAQLQAVHLTSFTPPGNTTSHRSVSLYGDRYARAIIYAGLGHCVEIYDWTASNLEEHRKIAIDERCDRLQLLSHDRVLIFDYNHILLCDIPALETCLPSSRHPGSTIIPCNSIELPGTRFVRGGPYQLRFSSSASYEFMSCTDAGIFAVKLSGTSSNAHLLHAIENEEDVTDVVVGARRVYIRSYQFAEAFSYNTEQIGPSDVRYCTTPPQQRFITKECIPYLEPKMDETSGRIAMAASSYAIGVFYHSQFDKHKLFMY